MKNKFLWIILLGAFLVRFIGLANHPAGFTPDEASFGYDAYSILKTGQDQWGNWMPLSLKSFGDYKLPLYTYLSVPAVWLFGLSIFSTRLLSVILGTMSVFVTYKLTNKIFKKENLALVSSLLLAFSPWHIALSRGAFEANMTTFFMTAGLLALLLSKENKNWLILGSILLGLNLFTYHTARLLTFPLLLVFLVFYFTDINFNKFKHSVLIFAVFILLSIVSIFGGGGSRLATSNVFSLANNVYTDRFAQIVAGEPEILAKLTHNKLTYVSDIVISRYIEYVSPQFFFVEGAREATYGMIPGMGVLYLFEVFSLLAFIVILFRKPRREYWFFVIWIFITAFPASLSLGPGLAANRVAFMMPAIQIVSALGIIAIFESARKWFPQKLLVSAGSMILIISFAFFVESYWFVQPIIGGKDMLAGTEEIFGYTTKISDQYDQIIVTKDISEAHIYPAFYNKIDPKRYQRESEKWEFEKLDKAWVDQIPEYSLDKYVFRSIDWQRDLRETNALIIASPKNLPESAEAIKTFYYPDGSISYVVLDTRVDVFAKK